MERECTGKGKIEAAKTIYIVIHSNTPTNVRGFFCLEIVEP